MSLLLIFSIVLLVAQVLFVMAIRPRTGYESNFAFVLLLILGVLDIVQLAMHAVAAISLLSMQPSTEIFYIFGAAFEASWLCSCAVTCYLPLQRLVWVLFPLKAAKILPVWFLKGVLTSIVVVFLISLSTLVTPYNGVTYVPELLYWFYQGNYAGEPWMFDTFLFLDKLSAWGPPAIGAVSNVIIIGVIVQKSAQRKKIRDLGLTFHTVTYILYAMIAFWYWNYFILNVNWVYWDLLSNIIWIFYNGINPILYAVFNASVRKQMKTILVISGGRLSKSNGDSRETQRSRQLSNTENRGNIHAR